MITQFDNPALLTETGVFESERWHYLAQILNEAFGNEFYLAYIPRDKRTEADSKPYAVVHDPGNRSPYFIMFLDERDDPRQALARIIEGKSGDALKKVEASELAAKIFEQKRQLEISEAKIDELAFYLDPSRSKHYMQIRKGVKINDHGRRV